ncbi:hypothetical protein PInf_000026 [Phytophthora infestans]|nr:hypothetical protein PInf_000026 [Phytophthora infestans]
MNLSKPTALAAFAAKQQLLDDLDIPEKGGKTLAQLKIPPLKTLDDSGDVGPNPKQLKELTPLGGGVSVKPLKAANVSNDNRESSSRKLTTKIEVTEHADIHSVAASALSPRVRRQSSLKSLAATDKDNRSTRTQESDPKELEKTNRTATASDANTAPTQDETSQKEGQVTDTKPSANGDSEEEDFTFDDSGDETKTTEQEKSNLPPVTELRQTSIDLEDLYDCPPDATQTQQQREPKMFLPRASDIELFHLVLTEDTDQLERYLQDTAPCETLEVVDTTQRTLYHYAALSKNKKVQEMILQHVDSYHDAKFELELQTLMRKKAQMNIWMQDTEEHGKEWVPPRVKELQRQTTQQKCADWARICSKVDENGRTLFHYISTTTYFIPNHDDYELCSVLRSQPNILSTKDKFKKLPLHYAVESGNLKLVKWVFRMGIKLNQADVDLLLSFNVSRVMENVLLRQLEAVDFRNYYLSNRSVDTSDVTCDPGVSTFVLAKLHRKTDDSTGHRHQLPIHRAAMFGNIRAVELLLEEGADPNTRDANKWTPLHYCADEATPRHLIIAQLLVESSKRVDVNAKSLKGRSPLHIAIRSINHNTRNNNGAEACESQDRLSFVTYLHECRANLDLKDNHEATPLLLACRGGDVGVATFLLRAGCDPTAVGDNKWNPLHFAAIRGNPSMVQFLLSWDADSRLWIDSPGIQGRRPIDVSKNDSIRQMLINLWMECYNGNVDHVRRLLLTRSKEHSQASQGVQLMSVKDTTTQTERTSLHLAISGYMKALELPEPKISLTPSLEERLKQAKASEVRKSAPRRYLQVAILLLQAGADLSTADRWGITPLMLAASIKDPVFMETLLERLPDDNDLLVVDTDGNTALHYSYAFCQAHISTMLEDRMDDSEIENKQGKTPFEMTGYRDKIYPKEYRGFLQQQRDLRNQVTSSTRNNH